MPRTFEIFFARQQVRTSAATCGGYKPSPIPSEGSTILCATLAILAGSGPARQLCPGAIRGCLTYPVRRRHGEQARGPEPWNGSSTSSPAPAPDGTPQPEFPLGGRPCRLSPEGGGGREGAHTTCPANLVPSTPGSFGVGVPGTSHCGWRP